MKDSSISNPKRVLRFKPISLEPKQLRFTPINEHSVTQEPQGDSWGALIPKSIASGALSIADLPQAAYGLGKVGANAIHDYFDPKGASQRQAIDSLTPSLPMASDVIKSGIKNITNYDLTPHPTTPAQRIASHAAEFVGGGTFGGLPKSAMGLAKTALGAATIGGTSAALQEGGVNPLVADIGSTIVLPIVPAASKNILNKFTKDHRRAINENKVASTLKKDVGEENISKALRKVRQHNKGEYSDIPLTTPEIVQSEKLSKRYNSLNLPETPIRNKAVNQRLLDQIEPLSNKGSQQSDIGRVIREPILKKFEKDKLYRAEATIPLYQQLEAMEEGINPVNVQMLLASKIPIAAPATKSILERYQKGLYRDRTTIDQEALQKIDGLRSALKEINVKHKDMPTNYKEQLKAPFKRELQQIESATYPRPVQIDNTIKELSDKANTALRYGDNALAQEYLAMREAYIKDLSTNPIGLKHREKYAQLSKPINEIESSNILYKFVKKNTDIDKQPGFVTADEYIPSEILKAKKDDLKLLKEKTKGNKEILNHVKGVWMDELLNKSASNGTLSYNQANKFLNDKFNKERIETIFNVKERKQLDDWLGILKKRDNVAHAGKLKGIYANNSNIDDLTLGIAGDMLVPTSVKAAGRIVNKSGLWDKVNPYKTSGYDARLEQAMLDPEYFGNLLTQPRKVKGFNDFYNPLSQVGYRPVMLNKEYQKIQNGNDEPR